MRTPEMGPRQSEHMSFGTRTYKKSDHVIHIPSGFQTVASFNWHQVLPRRLRAEVEARAQAILVPAEAVVRWEEKLHMHLQAVQ